LLVANWPIVLHGWIGSPIEPLWSVSIEEQFYLLWPFLYRSLRCYCNCGAHAKLY
jgi:peptidoglycan/LPS O-acetylase OafA/YrhL